MSTGAACPKAAGGARRRHASRTAEAGAALVDVVVSLALLMIATGAAVPMISSGLENQQARQAARYMAGRLHYARFEALRLNANVAAVFSADAVGWPFVIARDGNGNGIRRREVEEGTDPVIASPDRIGTHWRDVSFSVIRPVPGIDGTEALGAGDDPLRVGASNLVSFSPLGTATSGTLYLAATGGAQFAVRVMGVTGRVRVLRFDQAGGQWVLQ